MFLRVLVAITAFVMLGGQSFACVIPPPELTRHHAELVRDTENIVLAKATGASNEKGQVWGKTYNLADFKKIRVIKGRASDRFTIENGFFLPDQGIAPQDFNGHAHLKFWDKSVTRQWNMPDCEMRPVFFPGRTYLLFLDNPHWRAYEEIVSEDDLWLQAVQNLVADPKRSSGLSVSAKDWLLMAESIFRGTITNCAGPQLKVEETFTGKEHVSWAYTNKSGPDYWPFETCKIGEEFIVLLLVEPQSSLPFYSSSVFSLKNGAIDISERRDSEIVVQKNTISLVELRSFFAEKAD